MPKQDMKPEEVIKRIAQITGSLAVDVAQLQQFYELYPWLNELQPPGFAECLPCSIDEWALKLSSAEKDWLEAKSPAMKFKTIPVTVYGFSSPDVPEETRNKNIERANKAVELMDSASRQIVQDVCDLVARAAGSDLAEALEKVMLDADDATSLAHSLEFWARKHRAAGAELHGACCNRPTHASTQKILDEQLE